MKLGWAVLNMIVVLTIGMLIGTSFAREPLSTLGPLVNPQIIMCGEYFVADADNLKSPVAVYKTGGLGEARVLYFEYVDTFDCVYEITTNNREEGSLILWH